MKKTFVVLVEDNEAKADNVKKILENEGAECYQCKAINPALRFISKEFKNIDGIVLDLGLPRFENERVNDICSGLEIIEELKRLEINIPVLINSSTRVDIDREKFSFVFEEQRFRISDEISLKNFFQSLSTQKEQ